jgi:hypothetical protein
MVALTLLGMLTWLGLLLVALAAVALVILGDVGRLALQMTWPAPNAASDVIANGYLRLYPQEWIHAVEKWRAALDR